MWPPAGRGIRAFTTTSTSTHFIGPYYFKINFSTARKLDWVQTADIHTDLAILVGYSMDVFRLPRLIQIASQL